LRLAGLRWPVILLGLASPAAWHDFLLGQNGTLTGAILVAALLTASQRPKTAGVLTGILTIKPHLGAPLLIAALRLRAWRLVLCAAAVAALLVALASLVWGVREWAWFFGVAQRDEWLTTVSQIKSGLPGASITVFHMARSLGVPETGAWAMQLGAAIGALLLLWKLWQPGAMAEMPRLICTICLNVLIVPHGFMYDLVGFSTVMAIMMTELSGWPVFAAALLWLLAGYTGIISLYTRILDFPIFAVLGAGLAWRFKHDLGGIQAGSERLGILPSPLKREMPFGLRRD